MTRPTEDLDPLLDAAGRVPEPASYVLARAREQLLEATSSAAGAQRGVRPRIVASPEATTTRDRGVDAAPGPRLGPARDPARDPAGAAPADPSWAGSARETGRGRRGLAPVAWIVAAAAVAAVAVVVLRPDVVGMRGTASKGSSGGASASATASPTASTPANAQEMLALAAQRVSEERASGRYWYVHWVRTNAIKQRDGRSLWTMSVSRDEKWWMPHQPADTILYRRTSLGMTPATDADRARWIAAGRPRTLCGTPSGVPPLHGCDPASRITPVAGRSFDVRWRTDPTAGTIGLDSFGYDWATLRAMPTTPVALRAYLARTQRTNLSPADLMLHLTAVLSDPVRPAVRRAAFELLASTPELIDLGPMTDARGRQGYGVALEVGGADSMARVLIVDPRTGRLLEDRAGQGGIIDGTAEGIRRWKATTWVVTTYLATEWVDRRPRSSEPVTNLSR